MPYTGAEFDCSFVQAVFSIAGVFLTMAEAYAGVLGVRVFPILDWVEAVFCTACI
jgi:hypothetical protein